MDNTVITLLSSLVSGLVGVLIGTWLNRYYENRKTKMHILEILITYRWLPTNQERIAVLNCIPIVFCKDAKVCDAFEKYKQAHDSVTDNITNPAVFPQKFNALNDAYIKVVETIARNLKLNSSVSWDKLKDSYIPKTYIDPNGQQRWY